MTRRELLGRTLLGAQVILLAACGGDDEDEAEQPRAAPTAPQASVPKLSRESVVLTLAASRGGGPMREAVRQWNEGNIPGVPDNVECAPAGRWAEVFYIGKPRSLTGCLSQRPYRKYLCRHRTGHDGF